MSAAKTKKPSFCILIELLKIYFYSNHISPIATLKGRLRFLIAATNQQLNSQNGDCRDDELSEYSA